MSVPPPLFYSDPASALVAIDSDDPDFTGPERLARESAACTVTGDDAGLVSTLSRAWRSGAPEDILWDTLKNYAAALELTGEEVISIANASRFISLGGADAGHSLELVRTLEEGMGAALFAALADAQGDEDPCPCPACIAKLAELN